MRTEQPSLPASLPVFSDLAARVDAAATPLDRLVALCALMHAADAVQRAAVQEAKAGGASWAAVAKSIGVTRQAATQKHQRKPDPSDSSAVPAEPTPAPKRPRAWTVTTPGGWELLRIRKD